MLGPVRVCRANRQAYAWLRSKDMGCADVNEDERCEKAGQGGSADVNEDDGCREILTEREHCKEMWRWREREKSLRAEARYV
jgi:hypothetical protein